MFSTRFARLGRRATSRLIAGERVGFPSGQELWTQPAGGGRGSGSERGEGIVIRPAVWGRFRRVSARRTRCVGVTR